MIFAVGFLKKSYFQKNFTKKKECIPPLHSLAAEEGFEPSQTDPESDVLPLHNSAKSLRNITHITIHFNMFIKKVFKINIKEPLNKAVPFT